MEGLIFNQTFNCLLIVKQPWLHAEMDIWMYLILLRNEFSSCLICTSVTWVWADYVL